MKQLLFSIILATVAGVASAQEHIDFDEEIMVDTVVGYDDSGLDSLTNVVKQNPTDGEQWVKLSNMYSSNGWGSGILYDSELSELLEQNIQGTYAYNLIMYRATEIDKDVPYAEAALQMLPEKMTASEYELWISYLLRDNTSERVAKLSKRYLNSDVLNKEMIALSMNELNGMEENAVYVTQDFREELYKRIIQTGLEKHQDKLVVCNKLYEDSLYLQLNLEPLDLSLVSGEEIVGFAVGALQCCNRPFYASSSLALYIDEGYYEEGLLLRYGIEPDDILDRNISLIKNAYDFSYLDTPLPGDRSLDYKNFEIYKTLAALAPSVRLQRPEEYEYLKNILMKYIDRLPESEIDKTLEREYLHFDLNDYALCYEYGKDYDGDATGLIRRAADNGNGEALLWLGLQNINDPDLAEQSVAYLEKALDAGCDEAIEHLILYYGTTSMSEDKVRQLLERKGSTGDALSKYEVGEAYLNGYYTSVDKKKGLEWMEKAAKQGSVGAMLAIGDYYRNPEDGEPDYKKALQWYQKAAKKDSSKGFLYSGYVYYEDDFTGKNYKKAVKCFQKVIELGNTDDEDLYYGYNGLAYCYLKGMGVEKDPEKALSIINEAIELSENAPFLYDSKGEICIALGKEEEALECYNYIMDTSSYYYANNETAFLKYLKENVKDYKFECDSYDVRIPIGMKLYKYNDEEIAIRTTDEDIDIYYSIPSANQDIPKTIDELIIELKEGMQENITIGEKYEVTIDGRKVEAVQFNIYDDDKEKGQTVTFLMHYNKETFYIFGAIHRSDEGKTELFDQVIKTFRWKK